MDANIQRVAQMLDEIARSFPRAPSYRTDLAVHVFLRVGDLMSAARAALIAAWSDVRNVAYQEQLETATVALERDHEPLRRDFGPLRSATEMVVLPSFKDDVVRALLRIKATFEILGELESIRPWWLENGGPVLDALADIYEAEQAVVGAVQGLGQAIPWVLVGTAGVIVVVTAVRHRRGEAS